MNSSFKSAARSGASALLHADAGLIEAAVSQLLIDSLPEHVSLWSVWHDQLSAAGSGFFEWLSLEERERAGRFHFERDHTFFVLGRGFLRWLLGESLDADPASLELASGPAGKPFLSGRHAGQLHFNLSHSGGLMICAVSAKTEVGVDIERIRAMPEAEGILESHFPFDSAAAWRRLPNEQQPEAFLRLWVRHEARVKRSGLGLAQQEKEESRRATEESVFEFVPAAGFVGALAVNCV